MCHLPVAPPYIVFPGPFPPDLGGGTRSPRFPLRSCLVASVFLPVIFFDIDWLGFGRIDARLVVVSAMAHIVVSAKANAARHQPDHVKDHVEDHVEDPPHTCC